MSTWTYPVGGRAIFTCPALLIRLRALRCPNAEFAAAWRDHLAKAANFRRLADWELAVCTFDGGGHREWIFTWPAGAHHINHPAHWELADGTLPRCGCGRILEWSGGDDPGHRR